MPGITEAVRQIRGTSCNQVAGVEQVLVTTGTGSPTSGLIRGAHRATWASRGFTLRMGWMTISRTAQTP